LQQRASNLLGDNHHASGIDRRHFYRRLLRHQRITGSGAVYCPNVKKHGYGNVIYNTNGNNIAGNGSTPVTVSEYESTATYKGFSGNINGSIQLPIEETPDFNDITMTDWENAAPPALELTVTISVRSRLPSIPATRCLSAAGVLIRFSNTIHFAETFQNSSGVALS